MTQQASPLARALQSWWLTGVLFVLLLPGMFWLAFSLLMSAFPDAGAGAMVFLPISLIAAPIPAAGLTLVYWLLGRKVRYWAGVPILIGVVGWLSFNVISLWLNADTIRDGLQSRCEISDPRPGQDLGECEPTWTVRSSDNPALDLFTQNGWTVGDYGTERLNRIPDKPSASWKVRQELSREAGLDFAVTAGAPTKQLTFSVTETQDHSLQNPKGCIHLMGTAILDESRNVVGAWIECMTTSGGPSSRQSGYSLRGRNLEQITGLSLAAYERKMRP